MEHRVAALRRRAVAEAGRREVLRSATLSWLRGGNPSTDQEEVLSQCLQTLKQLWEDAKKVIC